MGSRRGVLAMSTAAWMNERIAKENRLFPPGRNERPLGSPPRKTARDAAAAIAPHGAKSEEEWLAERRKQMWNNCGYEKRRASPKLTDNHMLVIKSTPTLRDPRRPQEEIDALLKKREEDKKDAVEVKIFGRPKSEEVAFMERMQSFSDITRG